MRPLLLVLLLALPASAMEWSKAHSVGVKAPTRWKVVARDDGRKALVLEGPKVGAGNPRFTLYALGAPGRATLSELTDEFEAQVSKRGWKRTARVEKTLGDWPAFRLAYQFQEGENARGRARVTVVLIGGHVFVCEVSGPDKGFPAATFDQIEKSLEVTWTELKLAEGATAKFPVGWKSIETGNGVRIAGPYGALVILQQDDGTPPEGSKEDGKLKLLGKQRAVRSMTREVRGDEVKMRWTHQDSWTAVVICPVKTWALAGPGARAIVASLRRAPPEKKED